APRVRVTARVRMTPRIGVTTGVRMTPRIGVTTGIRMTARIGMTTGIRMAPGIGIRARTRGGRGEEHVVRLCGNPSGAESSSDRDRVGEPREQQQRIGSALALERPPNEPVVEHVTELGGHGLAPRLAHEELPRSVRKDATTT